MEKEKPSMENKKSTVHTFKLLQDIQAHFCYINHIENTPELILSSLFEEMNELKKAIETNDKKEIKSEIADIIIFVTTLANCYGNIAIEEAISEKLERNFNKYNPALLGQLKHQGLKSSDFLKHMKTLWDRKKDKDFIK